MRSRQSFLFSLALVLALLVSLAVPSLSLAKENTPLVIEAQVLGTVEFPESNSLGNLLVQATSWVKANGEYQYIITLCNLSPWAMPSIYVLDRYLPEDPEQPEIDHDWFPERLEPGASTTWSVSFPEGPLPNGCHQLELSLTDKLGTILMDCTPPGGSTVWQVPLTEEMASYFIQIPLTRPAPSGPSKLGIHVTRNSTPAIMEFIRQAHPAVVMAVGDVGWLAEVKKVSPETVTIARFPEVDQRIEGDPVQRARKFVAAHAERYLANPGVDYWAGWNEPIIDSVEQMQWYAAFEAERTIAMAELGLKVAIGNFSAGTPEPSEFEAFLPAIQVAKEHGGILAVHEYSAPTLRDGVGAGLPGLEARPDCGALTLRYRYWYEDYLKPRGLVIPLVVTEAGIDGGVLRLENVSLMGWRDLKKAVPNSAASQVTNSYVEQLSWYDDELRRDPYVLGFAVFNVGDPKGHWASFDVTSLLPRFAQMMSVKK